MQGGRRRFALHSTVNDVLRYRCATQTWTTRAGKVARGLHASKGHILWKGASCRTVCLFFWCGNLDEWMDVSSDCYDP